MLRTENDTGFRRMEVRERLKSKFGERVIVERQWPAKSLDLSPLDWFWSVILVELRKNPPNSILELVNTIESYAASLNKDQIITDVNDILPRAQTSFEKKLIVIFLFRILFPQMFNIRQCINNIIITIWLDKQLY